MKKRILSILLLCCMVLTLLPTTAFAADELPDVKLSVPTEFDKTVDLTKQKGELKITDSKTYLIKGSEDPNWYFQYRIKIDVKNNTPHIFLDGVRIKAPKDGPAIELYNGASACLYFIGKDSELIGAENFAALQKNKTDGHLRVLVQTGTKLTCEGGRYGAGIGGSKVGIKKFSQGHGMNLHFGSLATNIYGGEILAISGVYGAGIGGGQGGVGEWIYVYSGKLTVRSVSEGAGIGGGQGGPGRFIYIKGGTVNAGSESGGAGIGSGDQDGQNKSEDAHHIEISGGTVEAWSNYAGAGIGGGRDGSGYDISITGGVVRAQGYYGAGIGGGMNGNSGNILIKDTTLTALALPLYPSSDYTELSASAVGRGSNLLYYMAVMQDQEFAMTIEENIKIGASDGKSVWLSATGWQWRRNQKPYKKYWGTTTELLIPNENGRVDLQRLSLPYAYNYGRVISELELRCEESTCSHEFGWAIRDDCHIWACKKCGARDPAAEMSKQNGKHSPGDWSNQKQLCTVCDHVLERDTKAPVMETLTHGESYTVEDTLDGKPGAYTFTVSDPAASGEASSGVKSVTINDVLQALGSFYSLPAPDGSNNDAGAEYTVVATDNAGNETTATVRTYRRHHEHNYGDWSKDGTSHWHECTDYDCPNRNESIKDKAAHDYTDDADTTCNVCGYERTVTPPAPTEYTVTVTTAGNGTASASHAKAAAGTEITLTAMPKEGYHFKEWQVMSGGVTIKDDKFTMPSANVEVKAIFKDMSKEQLTLAPGGRYYFDLSAMNIPGTVNGNLPDSTLRYVPFTYAGTVNAYKLTSETATTEEYAQQNKYLHSLFIADFAVTNDVSWDALNTAGLIFGKDYVAGGVDYTLRAPSCGSGFTGSDDSERGTPQSNEWDAVLDKNSGYVKNWNDIYSWGQDTSSYESGYRAGRGYRSARYWYRNSATFSFPFIGFRPVLEVLNPGTLGPDGLKAVTLDLGGGKLGGSSEAIQIIVKSSESFAAPASDGMTRPDGNTGSYFKWLGSDGELYEPGDNVSADVTKLTAQFVPPEQFNLAPDGTYYFDLSGVSIPGTVNGSLPDSTLHYVPFTYAGTVDAYALTSEMATTDEYAQENNYDHSLFIADYNVTHTVSWDDLNTAGLIFDKDYAAGGVDYTLRAPSAGSSSTGPSFSIHGAPQSNEWDRILDKDERYIQNIVGLFSWGQDTPSASASQRVGRGYYPLRGWSSAPASYQTADAGFRPVLEVLGLDKLDYDGLKAVTLDLGGGKLGNSSEDIQIIVKSGKSFTAPASDGLTRPDGNSGSYFKWLGSDGELYAPDDNVPADVIKLTAQFAPSSHSVTITTDTLPDGKVGEAYSHTLTATGTAPITWSVDGGLPADLSLNVNTGEISGTPTAAGTSTFTIKATNSAGSDTKELSITITNAPAAEHTVTVTNDGNGTGAATHSTAAAGTEITLTATPANGYQFKEWQVESPAGLVITNNKFLMPDSDVEVKAIFEKDAPPVPTDPAKPNISVTGTYTYNGSVHTATVNGYDLATMDISGNTGTDAGDYTVSVTSKTGKWADGSTDAVNAAWSIGKATQEAPIGLNGVAPSTEGGSDGKISGVTDKMEYRMAGERSYTACSGTEIDNLSAGNYFVRYAEDNNHFASTDAEVTVGEGTPLADCTITFSGNGGSGSMGPVIVKAETNYILPVCGFTAPPDQQFKAWEISGTEYKVGDTYTVSGDTEIKALWENSVITPTTYTVTVSNDGNGTGTATPSTAATGTEITLTAMPKEGYHFKEWQVISGGVTIKNNKFLMPNDNVEVRAIFEKDAPTEYTIIVTSGGNGTASASHAKAVVDTEITLTATPNKGYHFKEWEVISGGVTIKDDKFLMPNDNVEVKAIFEKDAPAPTEYTITYDLAGGTAEGNPDTYTIETRTFTLKNPTKSGYTFTGWSGTGLDGENNMTVTIPTGSTGNRTYTAHWRYNGSGHSYSYYTIKATAGAGGSISPSGNVSVREGRDQTFTITPDKGYAVANVKIDGKSIGAVKSYTFENVSRTHTIEVIFMKANGNPQTGVFVDVATGSYYEDAVDWAVENGITQGTDDTHFSPDGICTRAQAVTFLWRTAGSPEPETRTMPFTDVPVGSYYYDAVLWAVENGITKGTSDATFSPNMTCSRAQIVAFLWRSEKSPAAGTANPFADVKSTAYYADAVLWAVKEDITKGTTSTTFSPDADCTRAQIVTFLWRCKK